MQQWQQIINAANCNFADTNYAAAESQYIEAIKLANQLLEQWFNSNEAIQAYVCSYHNLAHLQIRQERFREARILLKSLQSSLEFELTKCKLNSQRYISIKNALTTNEMALDNNFLKIDCVQSN